MIWNVNSETEPGTDVQRSLISSPFVVHIMFTVTCLNKLWEIGPGISSDSGDRCLRTDYLKWWETTSIMESNFWRPQGFILFHCYTSIGPIILHVFDMANGSDVNTTCVSQQERTKCSQFFTVAATPNTISAKSCHLQFKFDQLFFKLPHHHGSNFKLYTEQVITYAAAF